MTLTLHTVSGAPRPWRVLLGLTFKGLDYETHFMEASKGEHKAPAYLKINPRGTIPSLDTGKFILRDSIAILAWLDREYPANPLFGTNADEAGLIWQITLECCDYLRAAGQNLLFPILVQNKPLPVESSSEFVALKSAADAMHAECVFLDNLLANNIFLAGDSPSAADAVAFPETRLVQRAIEQKTDHMNALGFEKFSDLYPRVSEWQARIEELENVDKTMPRHW